MTTVVAHVRTAGFIEAFTEIMQNLFPSANRRLRIINNFFQYLSSDFTFRNRFILHELSELINIFLVIKGNAITLTTITTGTARFLIISLHAFWHVVMDHKTNIRFIDTHTKGNSCNNNLHIFHQELILGGSTSISI
ncbi:hypothetical protein D3C80_1543430 [compost metagenome]